MSANAKVAAPPKEAVTVLYNGDVKEFRYHPHQKVDAVLKEATRNFGIVANQHLLSLFSAAGEELGDAVSLEDAGVKAGDELVLRPSVVKGG